jgi:hypothetical protein
LQLLRSPGVNHLVAILVLSGCGRIAFDPASDPTSDAAPAQDAAAETDVDTTCWPAWLAGTVALSTPVPVAEVNTPALENNPFVTANGLTLYFTSQRSGSTEFWYATRPTRDAPFTVIGIEASLSSPRIDGTVQLTPDELSAYISAVGVQGDFELSLATRPTTADAFTRSVVPMASVNTPDQEFDVHPVGAGLRIYFGRLAGGNTDILVADRPTLADPFGAAVPAPGLNTPEFESDPFVSPDELVMVFTAIRGAAGRDIYVATRPAPNMAFSSARRLDTINDPTATEQDIALSADGCELWFTSDRDGNDDLWVTRVLP